MTRATTLAGLLNSSGVISPPSGQVSFPASQVASADANTLDDYEEGTWTPTVTFGGGSTGITYSQRNGKYTKIGNIVKFTCVFSLSNKGSSTGSVTITGLPFSADTGYKEEPQAFMPYALAVTAYSAIAYTQGTNIIPNLITSAVADFTQTMQSTQVGNTTTFHISGVYTTT